MLEVDKFVRWNSSRSKSIRPSLCHGQKETINEAYLVSCQVDFHDVPIIQLSNARESKATREVWDLLDNQGVRYACTQPCD